ncbi:Hsp70 family protein [Cognatilysobacter bugurensis]|uniref:Heat-shock protein Hsp70 n=1 Tax=Cognatilysobacter bugurensis TaxID=543356 RepID=A0A918SZI7_9GAMM|nr:Hsp70 family protein [Lysobacter bugurensis]GHA80377.1 heat-shock protein Hsp70 [Lysobacter bugurensis]
MRIGIDFGTSYSAAGAVVDGQLQLVRFGDEHQFRTTVYFPLRLPDIRHFELTPELEREASLIAARATAYQREQLDRARQARAAAMREPEGRREHALAMIPTPVEQTPEQIRASSIQAVRRQWMAEQARLAREETGLDLQNALYGDEATDAYVDSGTGHLVVSPKSMLGYRLSGSARDTLLGITTHILRHIRTTASAQFGTEVRSAVLGRPVRFRSSMQEAGGVQAQQILMDAAHAAGFEAIEFLQEPAAAAIGFHRQTQSPRRVMVVDIGGGTTDLALANVGGPTPAPTILGAWGEPVGGTDVDIELSMRALMPLFGKGVTRTPVHHFYEASAAQDFERQANFRRTVFRDVDAPFDRRLERLQATGHTVRLNRAVEGAKIRLSADTVVNVELDYIEDGLRTEVQRPQVDQAASRFLSLLRTLMRGALREMQAPPEAVYLTGGMSRSPYIRDAVAVELPGTDIVQGNASLGVVTGLAYAASD